MKIDKDLFRKLTLLYDLIKSSHTTKILKILSLHQIMMIHVTPIYVRMQKYLYTPEYLDPIPMNIYTFVK